MSSPELVAVIRFSKTYNINLRFWWFLRLNSVELKPLLHWIPMRVKDQRTWIRVKEMQENSPNKKAQHLDATVRLSPELPLMGFSILSVMMVSHGASKPRAIFCRSCCDQTVLRWNVVKRHIQNLLLACVWCKEENHLSLFGEALRTCLKSKLEENMFVFPSQAVYCIFIRENFCHWHKMKLYKLFSIY